MLPRCSHVVARFCHAAAPPTYADIHTLPIFRLPSHTTRLPPPRHAAYAYAAATRCYAVDVSLPRAAGAMLFCMFSARFVFADYAMLMMAAASFARCADTIMHYAAPP